ncbi:MAG: hypothetical protein MZV63_57575 [Marinilabiliales bacterium]|nr:hypothetical protein [Marinilabiliales bacterium]
MPPSSWLLPGGAKPLRRRTHAPRAPAPGRRPSQGRGSPGRDRQAPETSTPRDRTAARPFTRPRTGPSPAGVDLPSHPFPRPLHPGQRGTDGPGLRPAAPGPQGKRPAYPGCSCSSGAAPGFGDFGWFIPACPFRGLGPSPVSPRATRSCTGRCGTSLKGFAEYFLDEKVPVDLKNASRGHQPARSGPSRALRHRRTAPGPGSQPERPGRLRQHGPAYRPARDGTARGGGATGPEQGGPLAERPQRKTPLLHAACPAWAAGRIPRPCSWTREPSQADSANAEGLEHAPGPGCPEDAP